MLIQYNGGGKKLFFLFNLGYIWPLELIITFLFWKIKNEGLHEIDFLIPSSKNCWQLKIMCNEYSTNVAIIDSPKYITGEQIL